METVVIKTFDNTFSAHVVLARLEQSGIPAYLRDEYVVGIQPLLTNAIGGVKLAVDVLDAQKALLLLESFDEEHLHAAICPKCNQSLFEKKIRPAKMPEDAAFTIHIFDFITRSLQKLFKVEEDKEIFFQCAGCKYETYALPLNTVEHN